jgi:cell division protease FtsH
MPNHFVTAVAGIVLGALSVAVIVAIRDLLLKRNSHKSLADLLRAHFGGIPEDKLEVHSREFPYRVAVDAYRALADWVEQNTRTLTIHGVPIRDSFMSTTGIAALLAPTNDPYYPTAVEYDSFDVGDGQQLPCIQHALWMLESADARLAILWTSTTTHKGCGYETKLCLNVAHLAEKRAADLSAAFFHHVETAVQKATTYRGKVLSLENNTSYSGRECGITIHKLRSVSREDVILPETTIRLLDRNVLRFIAQRAELAKVGMPTKKGVLFYGPPGTGKTHTIHYLIGALTGHTTLLMTAEQMGLLEEYIALARLLAPSVIVMEDVDLIGRDRDQLDVGPQSLLNRLLNEMDGLRADAEIMFLMTTNRPEALEQALASRPGRIDQAIEFPLPEENGRRKLIRLYSVGVSIADEVVDHTARSTQGVSASFIKELMRRALQFHLECGAANGEARILQNDVDQALDELLFVGGALNRTLLGAGGSGVGNEE